MAKLTNAFRKWLKNPLFVILLVVVVVAFWTANGNYTFTQAVVGPNVKILSVTPDLTNKVLTPGQTVSVTVTTKNLGETDASYKVEHRLVASKNFPQYLSVVDPVGNAVAGEDDSVITRMVSDQEPGEVLDIEFRAPVPTEESIIAGDVNNWDNTYVQIVGLYQDAGAGYMNSEYIVNSNIKLNSQYTGQDLPQSCETNRDCSGWAICAESCVEGICEEQPLNITACWAPDAELPEFSFKEYYNDHPFIVWIVGIIAVMLILGLAIPGTKR